MNYIRFVIFLLITAGVTGCALHKNDSDTYVRWVEAPENGLRQSTSQGNFAITLQFKPNEYIALHEFQGDEYAEGFENRLSELEGMLYFDLFLHSTSPLPPDPERYFDFGLKDDIQLISGSTVMNCQIFHHESGLYGEGPGKYILGFSASQASQTHDLILEIDSRRISAEPISIPILHYQIEKTPKLTS